MRKVIVICFGAENNHFIESNLEEYPQQWNEKDTIWCELVREAVHSIVALEPGVDALNGGVLDWIELTIIDDQLEIHDVNMDEVVRLFGKDG